MRPYTVKTEDKDILVILQEGVKQRVGGVRIIVKTSLVLVFLQEGVNDDDAGAVEFCFQPTDEELVGFYLLNEVRGEDLG